MTEPSTHDDDDEYLWTGAGPGSLELRALERELRPMAWAPRELPLPLPSTAPIGSALSSVSSAHGPNTKLGRSPHWTPILAGLAAAAAVLLAAVWLRGSSDVGHDGPSVEDEDVVGPATAAAAPAREVTSPVLVDPFARGPQPATTGPQRPTLVDPFPQDRPPERAQDRQSDLLDPFVGTDPAGFPTPSSPSSSTPPSSGDRKPSPDLEDPFGNQQTPPSPAPPQAHKPAKLVDPFSGAGPSTGTRDTQGPDLKDPFQH